MIGDRKRFHTELGRAFAEPIRPAATIQKTVICMDVKVDEFGIFFGHQRIEIEVNRSRGKT